MNLTEVQANALAASLLMPKFLVKRTIDKYAAGKRLPIYGNNVFKNREKVIISKMACALGVSFTALLIRLRNLGYFKQHDISEYITTELNIGGV